MKLDDIKQQLKGYFIYRNIGEYELGLKQGKDFKLITNNIHYLSFKERFELTPIRYLLMQINHQLLDPMTYVDDLAEVIPVIDFKLFKDYDDRNLQIQRHKDLLNKISESKSIFGRKRDFKLVYVKTHNYLDDKKEQIGYYVIKNINVVPIESALLDENYINNAVEVDNLNDLQSALRDNLENEYKSKYDNQVKIWNQLG